jgi:hypothetical protein
MNLTKTFSISKGQTITEEQAREIEEAKKYPITYDEDCPQLTPEMEKQFKCAIRMRNRLLSKKRSMNGKINY